MNEPPGARLSSSGIALYGKLVHWARQFTNRTVNKEPRWRHNRPELTTGYRPTTYAPPSKA